MDSNSKLRVAALAVTLLGTAGAEATVVDFESLTGPSTYAAAGARRDLTGTDAGMNGVSITGGTVLSQETFLPANSTTLYGTAFFGTTTSAGPYLPTLTMTLPIDATSFYLDVYNGQVFNVTYTLADNAGHSASFVLVPNLSSGTTQIGFKPTGNVITLSSDAGSFWDFSVDNIHYNEGLPTTVPTTIVPPPPAAPPTPPTQTVYYVAENQSPPELGPLDQRESEGLAEQERQRGRKQGKISDDFRLIEQGKGLDDNVTLIPHVSPAPVPVPAAVWLLASALGGLGAAQRRTPRRSEDP